MHFRLKLAYDGAAYHGWQKQPQLKTVQGVLEGALMRLTRTCGNLNASGRTDAGVHALDQVVSFSADTSLSPDNLLRALNSLLPSDIVVTEVTYVPEDFHARYSAKSKVYLYMIWKDPFPSPFYYRYSWHIPFPLNLETMEEAAGHLLGTHDFSAFRATSGKDRNPQRNLLRIDLVSEESFLKMFVEADAFLHHMVRNIVGTLVEIGRGRFLSYQSKVILESRDRRKAGPTAPPQGLFLYRVNYCN